MGSCFSSSHKTSSSISNSIIKHPTSPLKHDKVTTTTSPGKKDVIIPANLPLNHDDIAIGTASVVITPAAINRNSPTHTYHCDSGSREDMAYFDSKMWFDSDCEDDFLSVDGGDETTSSRGTTPVHQKIADPTPKSVEEKHPKRLVELFKETQEEEDDDVAEVKVKVKTRSGCLWLRTPGRSSAPATPYNHNKSTAVETQQYKRVTSAGHRFVPSKSLQHFNKSR